MTADDDASKTLRTYMGQPVAPHIVSGVECVTIVCDRCGHEVDGDGESWWHRDQRYEEREASDD
jgi:hypothetical protein